MGKRWRNFKKDLLGQKLKGTYPLPSAVTVFPVTFSSAFLCILLGVILSLSNDDEIQYNTTNCCRKTCSIRFFLNTDWKGPTIVAYYGIRGFPINHRRMQSTHCTFQMSLDKDWRTNCFEFMEELLNTSSYASEDLWAGNKAYRAPMGSRANVMFNDTFHLKFLRRGDLQPFESIPVPFTTEGILTRAEKRSYCYIQKGSHVKGLENTVKPRYWSKNITELEGGFQNVDFVVWMRPESQENFRKIYRYIKLNGFFKDGLPSGQYEIEIENSKELLKKKIYLDWGISKYMHFQKSFILFKPSWYGNEDKYLHKICLVTGVVYFIVGGIMLFVHKKQGISLEQMAKLPGDDEKIK